VNVDGRLVDDVDREKENPRIEVPATRRFLGVDAEEKNYGVDDDDEIGDGQDNVRDGDNRLPAGIVQRRVRSR
jgi:hypothetical protein